MQCQAKFLSTLSLRRATRRSVKLFRQNYISIHALLAESDTWQRGSRVTYVISIHALLAESDHLQRQLYEANSYISIHALLAESDGQTFACWYIKEIFLSTLSLRRATPSAILGIPNQVDFYPRSPCGERHHGTSGSTNTGKFLSTLSLRRATRIALIVGKPPAFLSTLSLRRATFNGDHGHISGDISIHALLAESDPTICNGILPTQ